MIPDTDHLFRLMFERSADAILLLDTHTNSFVAYNQAALNMLACSREELSTLHPSALSPELQPDGARSFDKANEMIALALEKGSHRFEWVHRSPSRADFWVEVLLTSIESGDAPMVLVVWRDITERRVAEQALREAQKRESLGTLAAGIAHDFNNLFAAISGHLELLRELLPDAHPAADHLPPIDLALRRATDLSRQMLAYGGRAEARVERVDVSRTVGEMAELLQVSVPKAVRLQRVLAPGLPPVRADIGQLQQVVLNLVTNAADALAGRPGGVVVETAAGTLTAEDLATRYAGQGLSPGRFVLVRVSDTGPGIPAEVRARMFDPFYSTKGAGHGLGLATVLGILRSHGAGYDVDTREGDGTRFTVAFPVATGVVPAPTQRPRPGVARLQGTVLLVDDEPGVRHATRAILEFLGATVLEARDGAEAIEIYRERHDGIDWVLMDLTMPRIDGHEAFLVLRDIRPSVKVVLASGWASDQLTRRYAEDPPAAFLEKPFRATDLLEVARKVGAAPAG